MGGRDERREANRTSQQQFGWNQRALDQAQEANRVDQQTPWGSKTWGDDGSLTTSLDPADQNILDMRRQAQTRLLAALLAGQDGQPMGGGGGKQGTPQELPPMPTPYDPMGRG